MSAHTTLDEKYIDLKGNICDTHEIKENRTSSISGINQFLSQIGKALALEHVSKYK